MIDWHCHILPGLDDGAESLGESLAMGRLLAGAGYSHICCTPHRLRGMYDTTPQAMRQTLTEVQSAFQAANIPLTLVAGMEYCLDEFFVEDFSSDPVTIGISRKVLVETPSNADPQLLRENIFYLVRNRYIPLFAHPERHAFLAPPSRHSRSIFSRIGSRLKSTQNDDSHKFENTLVHDLKLMGCEFQGNLGSVGGYYGSLVKKQEERLRSLNLFNCFGSDGHDVAGLEMFLAPALNVLKDNNPDLLRTGAESIA